MSDFIFMRLLPVSVALTSFLAGVADPALAQSRPDAGRTLQELSRPKLPEQGAAPNVVLPSESLPQGDDKVRFTVREARIDGAEHIEAATLQAELQNLAGRAMTLAELQKEARHLTAVLREAGYALARVVIPAQEIRDGVVQFRMIEGSLAAAHPDNRSEVGDEHLETILRAQLDPDVPLTEADLQRTLLLAADLPGAGAVTGTLAPGDRVGTSDLTVHVEPGKAFESELSLDNFGNRFTGENRVNARIDVNSPTGRGDRLRANVTATDEALYYGRLAYDLPLGGDGLRAGVALSHSQYELGREFSNLEAKGTADTASLYGSYPLLRSRSKNIWLSALYDHRRLQDRIDATTTQTNKRADVVTLSMDGEEQDQWLGGGVTRSRLAPSLGRLSIDSDDAKSQDDGGPQTAGNYSKIQGSISRLQNLPLDARGFVSVQGQWAGKNLDSSEKFALGGAYGVRAYPQGEGIGDQGALASVELRHDIVPEVEAKIFYDWGRILLNANDYSTTANSVSLGGYGLGLSWTPSDLGVSLSGFVAWRDRQEATSAPDRNPRAWVQAGWKF